MSISAVEKMGKSRLFEDTSMEKQESLLVLFFFLLAPD
jgi:hypothetical protein